MSYAVSLCDGALRRHRTWKMKRDMKSAHLRDTAGSRRQLTAAKFGRSNLLYEALSYLKFFTHLKKKQGRIHEPKSRAGGQERRKS